MLKWLRKYNTWILVIGGILLMVAFLLPQTITEFGRRRMTGPVMRVSGDKIGGEAYGRAALEYAALNNLFGRETIAGLHGGDNADHWVMLTHEAERAGLVGGIEDGKDTLEKLVRVMVTSSRADPAQQEQMAQQYQRMLTDRVGPVAAESRLTPDDVYRALSKFRGVLRLRDAYVSVPRYSDRRLVTEVKQIADAARLDVVVVPAERLLTDQTPRPTEEEIQAHFEKFREVDPAKSDLGIGYLQPPRVRVSWLALNKSVVARAIVPDRVEVQKRLLRMYPSGVPAGPDSETARTRVGDEIRVEQTEKVMKTLEQAVKGEIERVTRKLDSDGEYKRLPEKWAAPDLQAVAAAAASRVAEIVGYPVPPPTVETRTQGWLDYNKLNLLPNVSDAKLKRGNLLTNFDKLVLSVREITGPNDLVIQVGVPYGDPLTDDKGDKYFVEVLDARKQSPPDTLAEVRDQVVKNIQRLNAYEQLKTQVDRYRRTAMESGLDAVAKAPDGVTGPAAVPLKVETNVRVESKRVSPNDPALDTPEFRDAVVALAANLDPTADQTKVAPEARVVVVPSPKALSLIVGRIDAVLPMTIERFRVEQEGMVNRLQREELMRLDTSDPFSQEALEKRLNVEYFNRDPTRAKPKVQTAAKPA